MKYGIQRILVIVLLCGVVFPALGQQEATMYFMNSLPQVSYLNPALQPRYKFSLGLPGSSVYAQYSNNAFKYNDFAKKQGDSVVGDLNKLYGSLKKKKLSHAGRTGGPVPLQYEDQCADVFYMEHYGQIVHAANVAAGIVRYTYEWHLAAGEQANYVFTPG